MTIPTPEEVQDYFKNAKDITCLQMGINIDISFLTRFEYSEEKKAYTVPNGVVMVWHHERGYAPIVKFKCVPGKCKNCEKCNEAKNK